LLDLNPPKPLQELVWDNNNKKSYSNVRANFSKVSNFMHTFYGQFINFWKICPHIAIAINIEQITITRVSIIVSFDVFNSVIN
jgi:hypothetical protein